MTTLPLSYLTLPFGWMSPIDKLWQHPTLRDSGHQCGPIAHPVKRKGYRNLPEAL